MKNDNGAWAIIVAIGVILGIISACITIYEFPSFLGIHSSGSTPIPSTPLSGTQATPTQGKQITPTQAVSAQQPTPTKAVIVPGQVLYTTSNFSGWGGSSDWHVESGGLMNDSSYHQIQPPGPTIVAPIVLSVANYAVEARITMQSCEDAEQSSFGITVRGSETSGSWRGYKIALHGLYGIQTLSVSDATSTDLDASIQSVAFSPGKALHTYRIEVKDNTIKVYVDGNLRLPPVTDNKYLSPGQVGLWSSYCQLTISSFQITAL